MPFFYHWVNTTQAHLDCDEKLLDLCEKTETPFLRFWESERPFVVLGKSNSAETETNEATCDVNQIPILRRCSGGGTVLQGKGCLNYAVILPISFSPHLATISDTTKWIMSVHQNAFSKDLDNIEVKGISDLTWEGKKFSGNAQRRLRKAILFHGTFLYNFDIQTISDTLKFPTRFPEYRGQTPHQDFVTNIPLKRDRIITLIQASWKHAGLAS